MSRGFWPVIVIVAAIIVWVVAKVVINMKKSEQQWREVDKTKLKVWEDED